MTQTQTLGKLDCTGMSEAEQDAAIRQRAATMLAEAAKLMATTQSTPDEIASKLEALNGDRFPMAWALPFIDRDGDRSTNTGQFQVRSSAVKKGMHMSALNEEEIKDAALNAALNALLQALQGH